MHFKTGFIALLCLVVLVAGCTSMTRFAYNKLDWLMYRKINKIVDLNDQQTELTKSVLNDFHNWHRATQLPLLADWLEEVRQERRQNLISARDVHDRIDQVQDFVDVSVAYLMPSVLKIVPTLSDDQVAEILDNMTEKRQEYIEDYVDVSEVERWKKHAENLRDAVKPLLGRLTKTQKSWVDDWAKELEPFESLQAKQQLIWHKEISVLLENRGEPEVLHTGLKALMLYRTDDWQPELEAILDRNQQRTYELVAKLINGVTPEQDKRLEKRLADFRDDFMALSQP